MDVENSKVLFSKGEICRWGDTNFKAFSFGVGNVLKDKSRMAEMDDLESTHEGDKDANADLEIEDMRMVFVDENMVIRWKCLVERRLVWPSPFLASEK